jgi:4-aminobutyrate aminotransferase
MKNAAAMGESLHKRLSTLVGKHAVLKNPRGLGLMRAVDVVNPSTGKGDAEIRSKILHAAFAKGLLLLGCGQTSIRFCPPLCVTEDQVETAMKVLDEAIGAVSDSD